MNCPKCGSPAAEGARFCEFDGARLTAEDVAPTVDRKGFGVCRCGAGPDAIDESGFCTECGVRRDVRLRDHVEMEATPAFAGVTDRGLRHSENQDDMALAVVETAKGACCIAVVCDGVSGSEGAASASAAAAKSACAALEQGVRTVPVETLMPAAIAEAHQAVVTVPYAHASAKDPPETTIVAAAVIGRTAIVGWAGDSRAYWVTDTDAAMITRDHSWVNDVVDAGQMTEEEALHSPLAHAIVRCLGGGSVDPVEPSVVMCDLPEGARLLLCSDGLWNYAQTLDEIASLVRQETSERPLDTARRLAQFAVSHGGKDNVTAIVLAPS